MELCQAVHSVDCSWQIVRYPVGLDTGRAEYVQGDGPDVQGLGVATAGRLQGPGSARLAGRAGEPCGAGRAEFRHLEKPSLCT